MIRLCRVFGIGKIIEPIDESRKHICGQRSDKNAQTLWNALHLSRSTHYWQSHRQRTKHVNRIIFKWQNVLKMYMCLLYNNTIWGTWEKRVRERGRDRETMGKKASHSNNICIKSANSTADQVHGISWYGWASNKELNELQKKTIKSTKQKPYLHPDLNGATFKIHQMYS